MKIIGIIGKVIGIILLVLLILFILAMIFFTIIIKSNDAYKGKHQVIVKNSNLEAPKALVVYQPGKSKASEEIADQLAKGLNESGYEVTITYPGKHISSDINEYSVIAFGSPVFCGKPSAALTGTMKRLSDYTDKTVIIYSVGMAPEAPELDIVKKSLSGKEPDYSVKFCIKDKDYQQNAYELGLNAGKGSNANQ